MSATEPRNANNPAALDALKSMQKEETDEKECSNDTLVAEESLIDMDGRDYAEQLITQAEEKINQKDCLGCCSKEYAVLERVYYNLYNKLPFPSLFDADFEIDENISEIIEEALTDEDSRNNADMQVDRAESFVRTLGFCMDFNEL